MIIIACIDNSGGMMFNKRRLSRDKSVMSDIQTMLGNRPLYMNEYSYSMFSEYSPKTACTVFDDFLNKAGQNDYCFIENQDIRIFKEKINGIVLYRWNRDYPSDFRFELSLDNWILTEVRDFQGISHNRITKEVYIK